MGIAPVILEATGLRAIFYETALAHTRGISIEKLRAGCENSSTAPLGRSGKLEEVANLVAFICSGRAGYIHGVTINVAGGKREDRIIVPMISLFLAALFDSLADYLN